MNSKLKKIFTWVIWYPLIIFLCFEIALRILGYGGYHHENYTISASPENAYIGDDRLGITLNPGTYQITLNKEVSFTATHDQNNRRVVTSSHSNRPDIAFFGCSFTYGYGVDDHQTFTSLIQEDLTSSSVANFGVPGYGTIQSLLQLKQLFKNHTPSIVVLNFSSLHFMRNTLSQKFRANLRIGYRHSSKDVDARLKKARFPLLQKCGEEVKYVSWDEMYANWPGRGWIASVNWLQSLKDRYTDQELHPVQITACIINQMNELCADNGVDFGVVFLDNSTEIDQLKQRIENIPTMDVDFDFTSRKYTNLPFDSHPNTEGHELLAKRISPFVNRFIR